MAGIIEKLLQRFGYVKRSSLNPEGAAPADPGAEEWRSSDGLRLPLAAPTPAVEEEIDSLENTAPVPKLELEHTEEWDELIARAKAQADAAESQAQLTPATRPTDAPPRLPRKTPPALPPLRSRPAVRKRGGHPVRPAATRSLPGLPGVGPAPARNERTPLPGLTAHAAGRRN